MRNLNSVIGWSLFKRRMEMTPRTLKPSSNQPHQGERETMRRRVRIIMEGGKTYYGIPVWREQG